VEGLAVTRDGRTLIAAGGNAGLSLWDTATWSQVSTLPTSAPPWGMALSPDEKTLAVTTFTGTIDIFDFEVPSPKLRHSVVAHQRLAPG
jgi:WD40 repeat protein